MFIYISYFIYAKVKLFGGDLNEKATIPKGPVYRLMTTVMKDLLEDRYPGIKKAVPKVLLFYHV